MGYDRIVEVERTGAEDERRLVDVLVEQAPSLGSTVFTVAEQATALGVSPTSSWFTTSVRSPNQSEG